MNTVIYATNPAELSWFLSQLHDTCLILNDRFTARISTPHGVRTLAGKVPAKVDGHRDVTHAIGNRHIKLKP